MICDSLTRASIIRWWFQRQPEHFLRRLMLSNWIDDNQAWKQPFHVNKNLGNCIERPDLVTRPRERRKINQNNWEREDLWRNDVSTQDAALCGQKQHSQCQLPIKSLLVTIGSSISKYFGKKNSLTWIIAESLGLAFFTRLIHKNSFKDRCGLFKILLTLRCSEVWT